MSRSTPVAVAFFLAACTGTATDENNASGTCSDDGSAWMMVADGSM